MKPSEKFNIVLVIGSVRPENNTAKILALVASEFKKLSDNIHLEIVDPLKLRLPSPGENTTPAVTQLKETIAQAHGIVLSTPEYNGSYSSAIKLVIENLGDPSALEGKPVVLLGVATGALGAVKALEHLSSVCLNEGALVLPGSVSVARVHKVLNDQGQCTDPALEKRIHNLAATLLNYLQR